MLTDNFKSLIGTIPQSTSVVKGTLPAKDVYGLQRFLTGQYPNFPYSRTTTFTTDRFAAGISIGSGTRAESGADYQLESHISSGVNATVTSTTVNANGGEPYVQYAITVTNTSQQPLVVGEICYKQSVSATAFPESTSASAAVLMMDRTLVEPVLTIPAGRAAVIEYRLMTARPERMVGGVRIVSWQYGSDEDVAAMITAAHAGTIDLREDGGWNVGDARAVEIGSFSAGGKSHALETVDLAITSFDDYRGCGCVMQADFASALATTFRVAETATNLGGYATSEMYTATLPAILGAMPQWLAGLALEFDVMTLEGDASQSVETVSGNRLALRSEVELNGTSALPYANEGTPIQWYQTANAVRQKRLGRSGSNAEYWLRSPDPSSATRFRTMRADGSATTYESASSSYGVCPFMCL